METIFPQEFRENLTVEERILEGKDKSSLSWIIAAGIVGADIGTSVFYSTGILFPIVGYLAPVCIGFVCLMMWLFKATYQEGLALSPYNGGAYSMILRSVGRRAGVLSGTLTIVSYLATAAVSSLSGAFYLSSLFDTPPSNLTIVLLSFVPIILFGLLNSKGIKEPAKLVTVIAGVHFFLLILMGLWSTVYVFTNDVDWSKMTKLTVSGELSFALIIHGLAAAFLGITGFESAAQIVEELQEPIHKTVQKLYKTVVILVSLTAPVISLMCLAILSEEAILTNKDFLLSGLANALGGKIFLTIIVINATLTLFAATNTAYVGFIGLATTMAKQGNLPSFMLYRIAHKFPKVQGYPLIALPFMVVAMLMTTLLPGKVEVLATVYGIAFLGVMVSFCIGVVLMRNRKLRRDVAQEHLSKVVLQTGKRVIPVIPLISGSALLLAELVLFLFAEHEARSMLLELFSGAIIIMAFYRWGVLEDRLETRSDLRLGIGRFKNLSDLPDNLPKYVLCAGGTGARRLINLALNRVIRIQEGKPFEFIVFHAEEDKDPEGFTYELLQRVVSQQIAPIYNKDFILGVKILPGNLMEGLITLKKANPFQTLVIGTGRNTQASKDLAAHCEQELEVDVVNVGRT